MVKLLILILKMMSSQKDRVQYKDQKKYYRNKNYLKFLILKSIPTQNKLKKFRQLNIRLKIMNKKSNYKKLNKKSNQINKLNKKFKQINKLKILISAPP